MSGRCCGEKHDGLTRFLRKHLPSSRNERFYGCGKRLTQISRNDPEHQRRLRQLVKAPDSYQTWKRYTGIYALAQYAAMLGIERLHEQLAASFRQPLAQLPTTDRLLRYRPPPTNAAEVVLSPMTLPPSHRGSG